MSEERPFYWDTSAILSVLLVDSHSARAAQWLAQQGVHLVSSLAEAELNAVLARLVREGHLGDGPAAAAADSFDSGPWRRLQVGPDVALLRPLCARLPLRGADLWHLALAMTLQVERPELVLLTFDRSLRSAALREGLSAM